MWDNMALGLDDAVVGPIGDWEEAYKYLPIFTGGVQGEFSIVVRLDDEKCTVGLFEEGNSTQNDEDYTDSVYNLSPSLDEFLKTLVPIESVDAETECIDVELDEESKEDCFKSEYE